MTLSYDNARRQSGFFAGVHFNAGKVRNRFPYRYGTGTEKLREKLSYI